MGIIISHYKDPYEPISTMNVIRVLILNVVQFHSYFSDWNTVETAKGPMNGFKLEVVLLVQHRLGHEVPGTLPSTCFFEKAHRQQLMINWLVNQNMTLTNNKHRGDKKSRKFTWNMLNQFMGTRMKRCRLFWIARFPVKAASSQPSVNASETSKPLSKRSSKSWR